MNRKPNVLIFIILPFPLSFPMFYLFSTLWYYIRVFLSTFIYNSIIYGLFILPPTDSHLCSNSGEPGVAPDFLINFIYSYKLAIFANYASDEIKFKNEEFKMQILLKIIVVAQFSF